MAAQGDHRREHPEDLPGIRRHVFGLAHNGSPKGCPGTGHDLLPLGSFPLGYAIDVVLDLADNMHQFGHI
jgi:hypothetical protein